MNHTKKYTNLAIIIGLLITVSLAKSADTPEKLKGCQVVSALEVKDLLAKGQVKLFDVRNAIEFAESHIEGAELFPYKEDKVLSTKELGYDDKNDTFDYAKLPAANMIFQCNGIDCWKSYKACAKAHKEGKKELYWFRGGLPEWKKAKYPIIGK